MKSGGQAQPQIDGFDWGISVLPRPGAEPMRRVRWRRHREPEKTREIHSVEELEAEISTVCMALGVERKNGARSPVIQEGKRMEKTDLSDVDLNDVIEAKRARLEEIDQELAELQGKRKALSMQIRALEKAAGVVSTRGKKRYVAGVGEEVELPGGGSKADLIRAELRKDPKKLWRAGELADELGLDTLFCNQALQKLFQAGEVKRPERGRYRAAA